MAIAKDKIYFKDSTGSLRDLQKFPQSYNLIAKNWEIIREAYAEKNENRKLFAKIPTLTCSQERFDELEKDLKLKANSVDFYYNSTSQRIVTIKRKKNDELD